MNLIFRTIIKIIIMIIIPLILSIMLFNPSAKYVISDKFVKTDSTKENIYNFTVGNLNEEDVKKSLISSYLENVLNVLSPYQRYDLYLSEVEFGDPATIFTATTDDGSYTINGGGSKKVISNVNLKKTYKINLAILSSANINFNKTINLSRNEAIAYLSQDAQIKPLLNDSRYNKYLIPPEGGYMEYVTDITLSTGRPEWYVKKSFREFLLKMVLFIILWNAIIIQGLFFMYEKLIKEILEKNKK